ncbi:MAG: hypothetical protein IH624_14835 [Phycisphaerae bacterium]|nr:hypothetical protein [Phycisphaerae bacterium]
MTSKINLPTTVWGGCLILLLTASLEHANAYSHKVKTSNNTKIVWANPQIYWHAGAKSFPADSPFRASLVLANYWWNQTPARFTFGIAKWGDTSLKRGNGQSEIWFSNDQGALKGAPAICYTWMYSSGGRLWFKEADIIFDAGKLWSPHTWQYDLTPYRGPYRPLITTAIHEMGHALGLGHENRWYNVMGQDYTHVHTHYDRIKGYPGADATQGALFLYGKSNTYFTEDVAVTHWKYASASGEYSTHTPTVVYNQNMTVAGWDLLNGSPRFHVKRGGSYHAEFTYENNGYNSQYNVELAMYISTNTLITTSDQSFAGGYIPHLPAGAVWTLTLPVVIPTNLTDGMTYYLGVIFDHQGKISEFDGTNNASYLQIKIVP